MNYTRKAFALLAAFGLILALAWVVSADDGRINPAPFHFGGDTLFCNPAEGCYLLNMTGERLITWPQTDIVNAVEESERSGENTLVSEGRSTYGPASLWVKASGEGCWELILVGYDEWDKQHDMHFKNCNGVYEALRLPLAEQGTIANCSAFRVEDWVQLKSDSAIFGPVMSINAAAGQLTFKPVFGSPQAAASIAANPMTVSCDAVIIYIS